MEEGAISESVKVVSRSGISQRNRFSLTDSRKTTALLPHLGLERSKPVLV